MVSSWRFLTGRGSRNRGKDASGYTYCMKEKEGTSKSSLRNHFIGIDEVGRGPLAGPITVCAVCLEDKQVVLRDLFQGRLSDSKKINKLLRNNIYLTIRKNRYNNSKVLYAISSRDSAYIDRHGISKAASACVRSCLQQLRKKGVRVEGAEINLDAGLFAPKELGNQAQFIKGDERFVEIALASILAKEWRDAHMRKISKGYPEYGWEKNVGYGTLEHRKAISKNGMTEYHRKTFCKAFKQLDKTE